LGIIEKDWKYHQEIGEKWFLRIRKIMIERKKPPDKWPAVIRRLDGNIWKWLRTKLELQWSDFEERKMLQWLKKVKEKREEIGTNIEL
jgi:hypothetical protein